MALPEFDLKLPTTLEEALAAAGGSAALLMAGGTDVMIQLKQGSVIPQRVVSLARVAELRGIREEGDVVIIGGGTTAAAIESSGILLRHAPCLVDAARVMATVQIRQRATVAGNLATAAACADFSPVLCALGATVRLRSAQGERVLPMAEVFTGARATMLQPGEILTAVEIAARKPCEGSAFVKFGYRRGAQIAVASAAAWMTLDQGKVKEVRLVLGAVAPTPLAVQGASALLGCAPEGAPLEAACQAASAECKPISDLRGSVAYRRAVIAVVSRQAIQLAHRRAEESAPRGSQEGGRP